MNASRPEEGGRENIFVFPFRVHRSLPHSNYASVFAILKLAYSRVANAMRGKVIWVLV